MRSLQTLTRHGNKGEDSVHAGGLFIHVRRLLRMSMRRRKSTFAELYELFFRAGFRSALFGCLGAYLLLRVLAARLPDYPVGAATLDALANIVLGVVLVYALTEATAQRAKQQSAEAFFEEVLKQHKLLVTTITQKANSDKTTRNKNNYFYIVAGRFEKALEHAERVFRLDLPRGVIDGFPAYRNMVVHALRKGADDARVSKSLEGANGRIKDLVETYCTPETSANLISSSLWDEADIQKLTAAVVDLKTLRKHDPAAGVSKIQRLKVREETKADAV
jgi:hypothetical protein